MFLREVRLSLLAIALGTAALATGQSARAEILDLGSTYTVEMTNGPTGDFGATPTLTTSPQSIDSGALSIAVAITPISSTSEFVEFDLTTIGGSTSGGPLAQVLSNDWELLIENVALTVPAIELNYYIYWTTNGTPAEPITAGSGFGVELDPNPSNSAAGKDVFNFVGAAPFGPTTSAAIEVFSDPYDFMNTLGVDTSTANGLVFGVQLTEAVPEPGSLALFGTALLGFGWFRRRRGA